jgi:hypothetical protein
MKRFGSMFGITLALLGGLAAGVTMQHSTASPPHLAFAKPALKASILAGGFTTGSNGWVYQLIGNYPQVINGESVVTDTIEITKGFEPSVYGPIPTFEYGVNDAGRRTATLDFDAVLNKDPNQPCHLHSEVVELDAKKGIGNFMWTITDKKTGKIVNTTVGMRGADPKGFVTPPYKVLIQ